MRRCQIAENTKQMKKTLTFIAAVNAVRLLSSHHSNVLQQIIMM